MSKGDTHDNYDFENDPEFEENFYNNINMILNDVDMDEVTDNGEANTSPNEDETKEDILSPEDDSSKNNSTEESSIKESSIKDSSVEDNSLLTEGEDSAKKETAASLDSETELEADKDSVSEQDEESAATLEQVGSVDAIDETLYDINNSLAKQISDELENLEASEAKKKKRAKMMKIQIGVVAGLIILLGTAFFLGFTKPGNQLLLKMGINIGGKIWDAWTQDFTNEPVIEDEDYLDEDDLASDAEEIDPDTIVWPDHPGYGRQEEGVYNILLLGEEAIGSGNARGRTDLIIIATLNKNQKTIKLTSLMRDLLVQIPGYKDNKLNSAYEKGDVDLLYETIALNFNIRLDGCVLVNFENFEKIIDYLGGLELTLTASEARYLRNTNYISNPKYRTVVEGTQLMNGNQVLGYSRIRDRAAITGKNNDYGRTDRHRIILNAIFEKYKTKSEIELVSMMLKIIPLVKTDISSKTFENLINTFIEMGTLKIDQLRIPADGTFTDNVKVRGMDVLIPDLDENIRILHEFIFGN